MLRLTRNIAFSREGRLLLTWYVDRLPPGFELATDLIELYRAMRQAHGPRCVMF
jgi:hypothetical protein